MSTRRPEDSPSHGDDVALADTLHGGARADMPSSDPTGGSDDAALAETLASDPAGGVADALAETLASDAPSRRETRRGRRGVEPCGMHAGDARGSGRNVTREDAGRYELDEELGRGGMGRVVSAHDRHLGRDVAMKELLVQAFQPDAAMSVGAVTRFLREARITGQLEHPSIVPVHELGQREDGTIYYTMQRIRGRSLARALREAQTLAERLKLLGHFRDVCDAVAYAHSRGVVHRDIKPENVMVGEFGETLLVDWGLAKVKGESDPGAGDIVRRVDVLRGADASHTVDGHAIGTPAYMSPEQARGDLDAIDERSDVWGLGAMLFEILTGRPPYVGKSALEVLDKVVSEPAPRVRTIEKLAPPELAAIADRALVHEPSSRYVGAKPLADEIAAYQDGAQVKAYQYGARERFVRFVRRHRAASAAAALVLVAVVVSTGLVGRAYRQSLGALRAAQESRTEAHASRADALRRASETSLALADVWLQRAERALDAGDPAAAALYAATALVRAEEGDDTGRSAADRERAVLARSLLLDAEASQHFVFDRFVDDAEAALSRDGRQLALPSAAGISLRSTTGGASREVSTSSTLGAPNAAAPGDVAAEATRASQLLAFLDDDRVVARFDAPDGVMNGVLSLGSGERVATLPEGALALSVARHGDPPARLALALADGELQLLRGDTLDVVARAATAHRGGAQLALSSEGRLAVTADTLARVDVLHAPAAPRAMGAPELASTQLPSNLRRAVGVPELARLASIRLPAPARALAWSATGEMLAVGLADPSVLVVGERGESTPTWLATPGVTTSLAFSGDELVVATDGRLTVLDVMRGVPVETLHVPSGEPMRIEATATTLVALPAGAAARRPRARIFTREPAARRTTALGSAALDLARMGDGSLVLATAHELLMAPLGPRGLGAPRAHGAMPAEVGFPARLALGDDGSALVSTTRGALVWFSPSGRAETVVAPADAPPPFAAPIAFAPGNATAYVGRADGTVARVRASGVSSLPWLMAQRGAVTGLAISREGQTLAVASLDGTVQLCSLTTERASPPLTLAEPPTALALSPDGRRLAIGDRSGHVEVRSLDAPTRREVRFLAHEAEVRQLAWSADSRSLMSTSARGVRVHTVLDGDARLERIVRVRGDVFRALFVDRGRQLVLHDGVDVVLVPNAPARRESAAALLSRAERRAGARLDGTTLVPLGHD